jgi:hypothetical protein
MRKLPNSLNSPPDPNHEKKLSQKNPSLNLPPQKVRLLMRFSDQFKLSDAFRNCTVDGGQSSAPCSLKKSPEKVNYYAVEPEAGKFCCEFFVDKKSLIAAHMKKSQGR